MGSKLNHATSTHAATGLGKTLCGGPDSGPSTERMANAEDQHTNGKWERDAILQRTHRIRLGGRDLA